MITLDKEAYESAPESIKEAIKFEEQDGKFVANYVPAFKKDEAEKHRKNAESQLVDVRAQYESELEKARAQIVEYGQKIEEVSSASKQEQEAIKAKIQSQLAEQSKGWEAEKQEYLAKIEAAKTESLNNFKGEQISEFVAENFQDKHGWIKRDFLDQIEAFEHEGTKMLKVLGDEPVDFNTWKTKMLESETYRDYKKIPIGSGGGATPSKPTNNSGAKTITRSQFNKLSPAEQMNTIKSGTTLTDE